MNKYNSKNNHSDFTGFSNQSMYSQQIGGKINTAFNRSDSIIPKPNFINDGKLLHNNMPDYLHELKIVEYKITIHTKDRDVLKYPSPFKIKIPCNNSTESFSIKTKLTKVKYINLDSVILPRSIAIDTTNVTNEKNLYPTGSKFSPNPVDSINPFTDLSNNRYLILKIKELGTSKILGTSTLLDKDTFLLYKKECLGMDGALWKPLHSTVVFASSNPFELKDLTMTLYDEDENELKIVGHDGSNIMTSNISGTSKTYNEFVSSYSNIPSVAYTNKVTQAIFNFSVGHIENEMNINNYDV